MGRISELDVANVYTPMGRFRCSGPGVRQLTTGDPSYFSLDGGATNLNNWNNFATGNPNEDLGDWAPSAGPDAMNPVTQPRCPPLALGLR
jgi:hypothetical protein